MDSSTLRVGRDGVSLKGRDTIVIFVLLVFAGGLSYTMWTHIDKDEQRGRAISERIGVMQQEHDTLRISVDANTSALRSVTDQMELQTWLMIADPKQEAEARKKIGIPKLLGGHNPYPVRP